MGKSVESTRETPEQKRIRNEAAEKKKKETQAERDVKRDKLKQKRIANKKPIVNETQSQHFVKVEEIEVHVNTIYYRCLSSY